MRQGLKPGPKVACAQRDRWVYLLVCATTDFVIFYCFSPKAASCKDCAIYNNCCSHGENEVKVGCTGLQSVEPVPCIDFICFLVFLFSFLKPRFLWFFLIDIKSENYLISMFFHC